jgi:hypothetical protein
VQPEERFPQKRPVQKFPKKVLAIQFALLYTIVKAKGKPTERSHP